MEVTNGTYNIVSIEWPERPTCHGESPRFSTDGVRWREPHGRRDLSDPYHEPFRTCSYCGSIHPEDLYKYLSEGIAELGGSDWKYGWPHKFYVEGIPNICAGEPVMQCGYGGTLESWKERYPDAKQVEGDDRKFHLHDYPAPATVHAKWYNEHLRDLGKEALSVMCDILEKHAHIKFEVDGVSIKYSAPYRGYQA